MKGQRREGNFVRSRLLAALAAGQTRRVVAIAHRGDHLHQADAEIYVDRMGTTHAPEGWQSAINAGADGIRSDRPGLLVE